MQFCKCFLLIVWISLPFENVTDKDIWFTYFLETVHIKYFKLYRTDLYCGSNKKKVLKLQCYCVKIKHS